MQEFKCPKHQELKKLRAQNNEQIKTARYRNEIPTDLKKLPIILDTLVSDSPINQVYDSCCNRVQKDFFSYS